MIKVEFAEKLTFEDFIKMSILEEKYYGSDYITPAQEAYEWYKKYPYTVTAAKDGEEIAGFVNLFPVKKRVFDELKAGNFNDSEMTLDDIEDISSSEEIFNMFLCCVVVDEKYRRKGFTNEILRKAAAQYETKMCGEIVTDNVTEEGAQFSERHGFSFVCSSNHDSKVYIQKYSDFIENIK